MSALQQLISSFASAAAPPAALSIAHFGNASGSQLRAYPFTAASGYGTPYTNGSAGGNSYSINGNPSRSLVFAANFSASPYIRGVPWSDSTGYGTNWSDPSTLPTGAGAAIDCTATEVAVSHTTTPFVTAYPYTTAFGTKYANPGTTPTGDGSGLAFSANGSYIAVGHATTPFITAYPWSGSGFGTKYANPGTLPGSNTGSTTSNVRFSTDSAAVLVGDGTSPFIVAYPISGSGFGTKFSDPSSLPPQALRGLRLSSASVVGIQTNNTNSALQGYPFSSSTGFGTKFSDPSSPVANSGNINVGGFGSSETTLIAGLFTNVAGGRQQAWSFSNSTGFGTRYANPVTAMGFSGAGCYHY